MPKLNGSLSYIATGIAIAVFAYSLFLNAKDFVSDFIPSPPIFEATLLVPDFKAGENPLVQYNRKIYDTFKGQYFVEVRNAVTGQNVCTGGGVSLYSDTDVVIPSVTLDWYVNDDCALSLKSGQYFIETNYYMETKDYPPPVFYTTNSNIFNIF